MSEALGALIGIIVVGAIFLTLISAIVQTTQDVVKKANNASHMEIAVILTIITLTILAVSGGN